MLKPGGRLAFFVITFAEGLTAEQKVWAGGHSPEQIDAGPGYPALLVAAGFDDYAVTDVSDAYAETVDDWIAAWDAEFVEIEALVGVEEFSDRQVRLRRAADAARQGLRRRYLITAVLL